MKSLVLNKLKEAMVTALPKVVLDYHGHLNKFEEIASTFGKFERVVHAYFFEIYSVEFAEDIQKSLLRVMEVNGDVLLGAAINKLAIKLPRPKVIDSDYYAAKATKLIATLIWHVLMDTNEVEFKREVKKLGGKWQTLTTLFLGGDVVKDLLKGLHFKPGVTYQKKCGGFRLRQEHKTRLKRLASIPFELSDIATGELIMKGYSLKKDWELRVDCNGNKLPEHHQTKIDRFTGYKDIITSLKGEIFYLELEHWDSNRLGYKLQLEGFRPQGKEWETQLIDSAVAYDITEEQQLALMHHIYCRLLGVRVTPLEVAENWDEEFLVLAMAADPMEVLPGKGAQKEFGEKIVLKKAAIALSLSRQGIPTKYMFGWDFTTSGLVVAGNSFHSSEMMMSSNSHNESKVHDAHTDFGDLLNLGLDRDETKKVHQPLLHGCTWNGLLSKVHEVTNSESMGIDALKKLIYGAYGKCVDNIIDIADWGTEAISNSETTLTWEMPDRIKATHKSYFVSVHNKITVVSLDPAHKSGKTTHTVISNMPYCEDNRGRPLVLESVDKAGKKMIANLKVRGLYANITHSGDAYVLRHVVDAVLAEGMPIMLKHDDFIIHPSSYKTVLHTSQDTFSKLYETNLYQNALNSIAKYSKQKGCKAPTLIVGDAENVVKQATAFLMP